MPFLNLVRWKNLLILFATLFITAFLTLQPYFNFTIFAFYTASVIFIAAAGYALNDFFDAEIDTINKPEKLIAGKLIPLKYVLIFAVILYILGIVSALLLSNLMHQWIPFVILLFAAMVTISYASFFKKKLIWGNVAVAFTAAAPVLLPWIFEKILSGNYAENRFLNHVIPATFVFAWLMHFAREIVKDIEDINGDKELNCRSIPIVFNQKTTIIVIRILISITVLISIAAALALYKMQLFYTATYLILLITIPAVYLIKRISAVFNNKEARFTGNFIKLMMLTGLLTLVVLYFEMNHL